MTLHLHIDRIILHGAPLPSEEQTRLRTTLEAELSRLFTTGQLSPPMQSGGRYSELSPQTIPHPPTPDGATWGESIAKAVHTSLGPQPQGAEP